MTKTNRQRSGTTEVPRTPAAAAASSSEQALQGQHLSGAESAATTDERVVTLQAQMDAMMKMIQELSASGKGRKRSSQGTMQRGDDRRQEKSAARTHLVDPDEEDFAEEDEEEEEEDDEVGTEDDGEYETEAIRSKSGHTAEYVMDGSELENVDEERLLERIGSMLDRDAGLTEQEETEIYGYFLRKAEESLDRSIKTESVKEQMLRELVHLRALTCTDLSERARLRALRVITNITIKLMYLANKKGFAAVALAMERFRSRAASFEFGKSFRRLEKEVPDPAPRRRGGSPSEGRNHRFRGARSGRGAGAASAEVKPKEARPTKT